MMFSRVYNLALVWNAYKKYGHILLVEISTKLGPLRCADDLGLFIYTPLFFSFMSDPIGAAKLFFLTIIILSLVAFSGSFLYIAKTKFAYGISIIGLYRLVQAIYGCWSDVYVAYMLPFITVIPLVISIEKQNKHFFLILFFITGLVSGFADSLRIFASLPVIAFFLIVLMGNRLYSKYKKIIPLILLFVGYAIPYGFVRYQIHKRDTFLLQQDGSYDKNVVRKDHGFWHNMYLGFGFLQNQYGIVCQDDCAIQHVKKYNQSLNYRSPQYEPAVRSLIMNLIKNDFQFILKTFLAKLGIVFCFFLVYGGLFGFIAACLAPKRWYIELAFFVAAGIGALPGLLTIPGTTYILGFITCTVLYTIYSIIYAQQCGGYGRLQTMIKHCMVTIKNTD